MRKEIRFEDSSAILNALDGHAELSVNAPILPISLADVINRKSGVGVNEVFVVDRYSCIRMIYDIPMDKLIEKVCDAIQEVYNTDIRVSEARTYETDDDLPY